MKQQLIKELLELTKQQSVALQEENIEAFGGLLQQRQVIIDRMIELESLYPKLKLEKDEVLLKELVELDARNNAEYKRQFEEVRSRLEETRKEISQMRKRQQVSNIYSNPYDFSQEEGIFFDKK